MQLEELVAELEICFKEGEQASMKVIVAREVHRSSRGNGRAADKDIWSCFGPIEHEVQVELPEGPKKLNKLELIAALKGDDCEDRRIKNGRVQELWVLEIGPARPDEPGDDDDDGPTDVDIWSLSRPLQRMPMSGTGSRGPHQGGLPHLRVQSRGPSLSRSEGRAS